MTNLELQNKIESLHIEKINYKLKKENIVHVNILPDGLVDIKLLLEYETDQREVRVALTKLIKADLKFKGLKLDIKIKPRNNKFIYLSISSGKGGVGKSNVSVMLAKALNNIGVKTAILDCDLYGASIPLILGYKLGETNQVYGDDYGNMKPVEKEGIEFISSSLFLPKDAPLMWRGPLLTRLLTPFFNEVSWDMETNVVVIDEPPGTGDIKLDISNFTNKLYQIVISTADKNACDITYKAALGSQKIGVNIIGIIENMSYFDVNGNKNYLFGEHQNIIELSEKLNVPILGQIPLYTDLKNKGYDENIEKIAYKIVEVINNGFK